MSLILNALVCIYLLLYAPVFSKMFVPLQQIQLPVLRFYSSEEKTTTKKVVTTTSPKPELENYAVRCHLQAKKGFVLRGDEETRAYYYDIMTDRCLPFVYDKSDGKHNKFLRLAECEGLCKGSFVNTMMSLRTDPKEICSMQHDPGNCIARIRRFYYDVNTRNCHEFLYSGCGGNKNRFSSEKVCRARCRNSGA